MTTGIEAFLTACIFPPERPGGDDRWTLEEGLMHVKLIKFPGDRSPSFCRTLMSYEGRFHRHNPEWWVENKTGKRNTWDLFDMYYVGLGKDKGRSIEIKVFDAWDHDQAQRQQQWLSWERNRKPEADGALILFALSAWSNRSKVLIGGAIQPSFLTTENVCRYTQGVFRKLDAYKMTDACDAVTEEPLAREVAMGYRMALKQQDDRTSRHPEVIARCGRNI